jgi:predicted transcriptional regulator of viral defense system
VLGSSPSATANVLGRLDDQGLIDKVSRGHYAIRPIGSLGTSAATDDLGLAVAAAFEGRQHRIAYLSALSELGLLSHPVRTVFVACTRQVRLRRMSTRRLRVVIERAETIHLEAEPIGSSWQSSLERALFECALRVDLAGGVERLSEALVNAAPEIDSERLSRLANAFGPRGFAAWRRLASLSRALAQPLQIEPEVGSHQPRTRLDPGDDHIEWTDQAFRVTWNITIDELQAVTGQ